jgi:Flp pilus assembly protein CpaB
LLALLLVLVAAVLATTSHHRDGPPRVPRTVPILVAAQDLAAGATIDRASLRLSDLPVADAPSGALHSSSAALGRTVGAPVRRGEAITDVRLVGPSLATALAGPGAVAVPVRLSDVDTAALLRPGDRIDVLAAPARGEGGAARVVARAARVMAVPSVDPDSTADGALVVLATSENAAKTLAAAATVGQITVTLRANS